MFSCQPACSLRRHEAATKKAAAEENRLAADLEAARTALLEAQLRAQAAEADAAAAARGAAERERLARELDALTEERRGHFFQVHELEAKLRRVQADSDELREQVCLSWTWLELLGRL